jgi:microsomal dipeptidase-like Zn-dependent dipeptidase
MDWIPRNEGRIRKEEEVNQIKSKKNDVQYRHGQLSPPPQKKENGPTNQRKAEYDYALHQVRRFKSSVNEMEKPNKRQSKVKHTQKNNIRKDLG